MPTLLTIALWLTTVAYAGAGVRLPSGEDPAAWAPAFEFAGLDRHVGGAEPQVTVEVTAEGWTLRASDNQGTVRTARVDAPRTARDREEVALVAGGLIRAMAAASAPPRSVGTLPPPPPPPPPPQRAMPQPKPAPEAQAEPEIPPDPVAEPAPEPPGTADEPVELPPSTSSGTPEDLPPSEIELARSPPPTKKRERDGRKRVTMAPLSLVGAVGYRRNSDAAFIGTMGLRLAQKRRWSAQLDGSITAMHGFELQGADPGFSAFDVDVVGLYRVGRALSVGPMAGVSFRDFLQDQVVIGDAILPTVGGVGALTIVGGRWWAVRSVTKATWDIGSVRLIPAGEQQDSLAFFGVQTGLGLIFGNKVNPFLEPKTSSK